MDSYGFILFIVILEKILQVIATASCGLHSPQIDLTVAFRSLCCSISELRELRDPGTQLSKVHLFLHRVVDFYRKTRRSVIGAFDDDITNTPE